MAGSRKWMVYTDDYGNNYSIQVDESNGEAAGLADLTTANQTTPELPRGLKPRYVNLVRAGASGEDIKRKIVVGTLAALDAIITARALTLADGAYNLTSYQGERRRLPRPTDTAQNDGDLT